MPTHATLFNVALEILTIALWEEKEIKIIQTGKEDIKWSLFADYMLLYTENPKDAIGKLLELINKFSKISGYKVNMPKSVAFL